MVLDGRPTSGMHHRIARIRRPVDQVGAPVAAGLAQSNRRAGAAVAVDLPALVGVAFEGVIKEAAPVTPALLPDSVTPASQLMPSAEKYRPSFPDLSAIIL